MGKKMIELPYDIIGCRFGRLVVIERVENTTYGKAQFRCKCDCGNYKNVAAKSLRSGKTKSCGCLSLEKFTQRATKHNLRHTRLYTIWSGMRSRCYNPNATKFELYGSRGIKICDEWLGENGFVNFYNWAMSHGYEEHLTIDRIDSDKNYCPENCQWLTRSENGKKGNIKRNKKEK
jgi:hypothetical protein